MNKTFAFLIVLISSVLINAQPDEPNRSRPRVVVSNTLPAPTPSRVVVTNKLPSSSPKAQPTPVTELSPKSKTPIPAQVDPSSNASNLTYRTLSFSQIKNRIAEAKRHMQSRPLMTSMTESMSMSTPVRIAYYDWNEKR